MFKILDNQLVAFMLRLASERSYEIAQSEFTNVNMDELYDLCLEHELEGVVASHILKYNLTQLPEKWIRRYNEEKERLSLFKKVSGDVCTKMKENNIPMIILKNGGIMADIVDDPAACPMQDIDSLVRKQDFLKAHQILLDFSFTFQFRSEYEKEEIQEAFADGSTEYFYTFPDGSKMWFELSWRPIAGRWIRLDKEPVSDILFQDFYYAKDSDVGILSAENNLLQVCIHTAKHSYVRSPGLRLHLDVDRIVTNKKINWDVFLKKVEETHVKTSTYFSLLIPSIILGTKIPQQVLDQLKPSQNKTKRIQRYLKRANLLHPNSKKFSKKDFLFFQTSLYDSWEDVWKVLYPSWEWYKTKYHVNSPIMFPYCMLLRGLDLVGIRSKK